jgi:hypothetical protein
MTVPGIVQSVLGDAEILERIELDGDDELFVTESFSILYRAEGLLSGESTTRFGHHANRLSVSDGRRNRSITFEYSLDDDVVIAVPPDRVEAVLQSILTRVLSADTTVDADESVIELYRFSELTLVLTDRRLLKHVGEAVWDDECEAYHFADVTNIAFEGGSVATQIVLTVDGRQQRIEAPNEAATDIRERLQGALFAFHDVDSLDEFAAAFGADEPSSTEDGTERDVVGFDGVAPLETTSDPAEEQSGLEALERALEESAEHGSQTASAGETITLLNSSATASEAADEAAVTSEAEPAPDQALLERLDSLERVVEEQNQRLEAQQQTIEQLLDELEARR